jgi:DHA1 family bicyclomycin/chloramphenicol resistance-like MFS transporter
MLFSTLNKKLAHRFGILSRLRIGTTLQLGGVIALLVLGIIETESLILVIMAMFMVVASIGFTGPNAMAIAMSEQGARAGTASAIMGSMQFACGLLGGILLNFMWWNPLFNMALVMAIFVGIAAATIYRLQLPSPKGD